MAESEGSIALTVRNNSMRNACRSPIVLLLLVGIALLCSVIALRNASKWRYYEEKFNDLSNIVSQQQELLEQFAQMNNRMAINKETINNNGPIIFAITPTFSRPVQKAELTRLAQTFLHVKNFYWIVVEDSPVPTKLVMNLLYESGLVYQHLNVVTPDDYKLRNNDPHWKKPRGIAQRNAALAWIRKNFNSTVNGVVYFADDDNTYSIKLFQEMKKIKVIGVWPVGLVGGLMVERPLCNNVTNKVVGFNAAWKPGRVFPIDMAGFALNLKVIIEKKNAWFSYDALSGYHETALLEQMVTRDQLQPLADYCSKVYVWHTRTESPTLREEQKLIKNGLRSNDNIEV